MHKIVLAPVSKPIICRRDRLIAWLRSRAGSRVPGQKVSCTTEHERSQTMIKTVLTILTELPPDDAWAEAQGSIPTCAQQNRHDIGVTAKEATQGHLVVTIGNDFVTHSTIAIGVRDQPVAGRTRVTFKATGYHAVNGVATQSKLLAEGNYSWHQAPLGEAPVGLLETIKRDRGRTSPGASVASVKPAGQVKRSLSCPR